MKKFSFLLLVFACSFLNAQIKNEREFRIKKSDFPETAHTLLNELPRQVKRLKFYKELDNNKVSFEAKFKYKKHLYSVEFDKNGILEDIEIVVKAKRLSKPLLSAIKNYFSKNYKSFSIIKIQRQFKKNNSQSSIQVLNDALKNTPLPTTNYEIIVEVTSKTSRELKEITFNSKGSFLFARTLTPAMYEHILY